MKGWESLFFAGFTIVGAWQADCWIFFIYWSISSGNSATRPSSSTSNRDQYPSMGGVRSMRGKDHRSRQQPGRFGLGIDDWLLLLFGIVVYLEGSTIERDEGRGFGGGEAVVALDFWAVVVGCGGYAGGLGAFREKSGCFVCGHG